MDVGPWLKGLGLEEYAEAFAENGVDTALLPELTNEDLKDIGVTRLADRKRLLKAIVGLAEENEKTETTSSQPRASAGERRQLTVVFVDLVGSTELSGRLDPEDYRDVMKAYQDAAAGVVARYGGHVARLLGDGMLICFGYPRAHEDGAERAVRSALEIVAWISRLKPGFDIALQVRVGIATGLVVVSDFAGDDLSEEGVISGETPNLAARLQTVAAAGCVVISNSTRHLTGGLFSYEDLGPQDLKGFLESVQAWRVDGPRQAGSRFQVMRGGRVGALVGRQEELDLLLERWARARAIITLT